jgi:carbon-monoxide dehydrogenase medium subunit
MYPAEFAYAAPATLAEAVRLLQQGNGEAKLLAGGQSLIPLLKLRLAEPKTLIDLRRIPELRGIREEGDAVALGAMTTYFEALKSPILARRVPLVVEATQEVGDMQVRARGTIGGSLAHADPAGDLPAVILALDATLTAVGPSGTRTIPARSFFIDMLTTALQPDEALTQIRLPATDRPRTGSAYVKHHHTASG